MCCVEMCCRVEMCCFKKLVENTSSVQHTIHNFQVLPGVVESGFNCKWSGVQQIPTAFENLWIRCWSKYKTEKRNVLGERLKAGLLNLCKGPITKVKIFWGPVTPMKSYKCNMSWIFLTKALNENIMRLYIYIYIWSQANGYGYLENNLIYFSAYLSFIYLYLIYYLFFLFIHFSFSCQPYLFFCWWDYWYFLLLASSLNFSSKVLIASQTQWWRFSFIIQMNNLFFKKFIFENADARSR